MVKHELMIVADYSQETFLTLDELCQICQISTDIIHDLVAYGIIHPTHINHSEWMFDLTELQKIKTALRLQRDLEINLAGVALVLDLLDELRELRQQAEILERHTSRH